MDGMRHFFLHSAAFAFLSASLAFPSGAESSRARVGVAVADLRREPASPRPILDRDPLEESQLLYGEVVEILEEKGDWVRVSAVEQPEWTHNRRWEGYPGWMEKSALVPEPDGWQPNLRVAVKLGTVRLAPREDAPVKQVLSIGSTLGGTREGDWWKLHLLDGAFGWIRQEEVRRIEDQGQGDLSTIRQRIVGTAALFLGDPYYWGGRSAHNPDAPGPPHGAVDCSGLVNLAYRANGMNIPRDAHEQWVKAEPIAKQRLQPGDLVFLSDPGDSQRISHVMLYLGDGQVIEGPGTGKRVRKIGLQERLREDPGRHVYYGTYLLVHPELVEG